MSDIIKTQRSLATKAMHQPAHRFDHLYRLLCQREWIATALRGVLANTGARTPGTDGITKSHLSSEEAKSTLIEAIGQELRERSFRPSPVRRIYIPKSNGKQRPLGISTLKDRVVQMLLKMVLEPIWESDFLNCSNGFRPGRRTMDCIALLDSYINERNKYFWVIEGDIHAAFDSIHQITLHNLRWCPCNGYKPIFAAGYGSKQRLLCVQTRNVPDIGTLPSEWSGRKNTPCHRGRRRSGHRDT